MEGTPSHVCTSAAFNLLNRRVFTLFFSVCRWRCYLETAITSSQSKHCLTQRQIKAQLQHVQHPCCAHPVSPSDNHSQQVRQCVQLKPVVGKTTAAANPSYQLSLRYITVYSSGNKLRSCSITNPLLGKKHRDKREQVGKVQRWHKHPKKKIY